MEPTEYLKAVVVPLLKYPDSFKVEVKQDKMGVLLVMDISEEDMGLVVGTKGDTARSIRNLLRIVGFRGGARVSLRINEPETSKKRKYE